MEQAEKYTFLSHDRNFYRTLIGLVAFAALQNVIGYTVNMADNMMLGRYSQEALSGAATVNQIFFLIQQFGVSVANALVALSGQYWGEGRKKPIRILSGYALRLSAYIGIGIIVGGMLFPSQICSVFSADPAIIEQGRQYMVIVCWSFGIFCITSTLYAALRSVGIVKIAFYVSIVSVIVNCSINYCLIFGKFGLPELGIRGAAIGTLITRILEFIIVFIFCLKDKKIALIQKELFMKDKGLKRDFTKMYVPIFFSTVVWAVSIPIQTAILGHISSDALAANNIASTFYQYAKVVTFAMSSCSGVMIANAIGKGDRELVKQEGRTLSVIDVFLGIALAALLFFLRKPLLSLYTLTPGALALADSLIILQAVIMLGMAYQMPVSFGVIQGGGDAGFVVKMNSICTWCIVIPLTFMGAYWWHVPIVLLVLIIQSDQLFKCIPVFVRFRKYTWIKKLTRDEVAAEG